MNDRELDLATQIAELRGVVVEGFRGVHQRQDTTNGRIAKVEGRVTDLEKEDASASGKRHGIRESWKIVFAIASLIVAILAIIYKK